jgi:hypothetical protein
MDKPDAKARREDLDHTAGRPRLTPRPDGGGSDNEPMADILRRGDEEERTADSAARHAGAPLTESQRVKSESLADQLPTPAAEPREGDGQLTPPIAP